MAGMLDARARVVRLWRGEQAGRTPSLDDLRLFAATWLRDDALVIVAARPSRAATPFPSREPRAKRGH
jgi:hypothetical protein